MLLKHSTLTLLCYLVTNLQSSYNINFNIALIDLECDCLDYFYLSAIAYSTVDKFVIFFNSKTIRRYVYFNVRKNSSKLRCII